MSRRKRPLWICLEQNETGETSVKWGEIRYLDTSSLYVLRGWAAKPLNRDRYKWFLRKRKRHEKNCKKTWCIQRILLESDCRRVKRREEEVKLYGQELAMNAILTKLNLSLL